ncbi:MAG: sensor histidine kinase [Christensenella sp.]|nr:sensor histidine kinase [Christensenella sp.]
MKKRLMHGSIRRKLFFSMLILSVCITTAVTVVALVSTYRTMREQLIYDRRTNIGWLENRLYLETKNDMNRFYQFEVDKTLKNEVFAWYAQGNDADYSAKLGLINALNSIISLDSNINSIDLFNLGNDTVLRAQRSGASFTQTGDLLNAWNARDNDLQTNTVYLREGREIVAYHEIYRFEDTRPIALIAIHQRQYKMQDILADIKITPNESIFIYNDQNDLIVANLGENGKIAEDQSLEVMEKIAVSASRETVQDGNFWFYRAVNGGKLRILLVVADQAIVSSLQKTLLAGIFVFIAAVATAVGASAAFARLLSKPLIELASSMGNIRLDSSQHMARSERDDEIGLLQNSFADMAERTQNLIASEYIAKIEKRNAQLRALQAQINPHFIYNTLQAVGGMALKHEVPGIYEVTLNLIDIMRYSLNFSKDRVRLGDELKYLQSYLQIQNLRFGRRLDLAFDAPEDCFEYLVPKLILQPLVENCFEHGLAERAGRWVVTIRAVAVGDDLCLTVVDNGVGIPAEKLEQIRAALESGTDSSLRGAEHIGLTNVNARIRLMFGGEDYGLTIDSNPDSGTSITVRLRAVKEGEENNGAL